MSGHRCHVSGVRCQNLFLLLSFFLSFSTKWLSVLVEGLLSTGPTLSSFVLIARNSWNNKQLYLKDSWDSLLDISTISYTYNRTGIF